MINLYLPPASAGQVMSVTTLAFEPLHVEGSNLVWRPFGGISRASSMMSEIGPGGSSYGGRGGRVFWGHFA